LSEDGSTFDYVELPTFNFPDPKKVLRDAIAAEPSLLTLSSNALAERFKDAGVTENIARAVKEEYKPVLTGGG